MTTHVIYTYIHVIDQLLKTTEAS